MGGGGHLGVTPNQVCLQVCGGNNGCIHCSTGGGGDSGGYQLVQRGGERGRGNFGLSSLCSWLGLQGSVAS